MKGFKWFIDYVEEKYKPQIQGFCSVKAPIGYEPRKAGYNWNDIEIIEFRKQKIVGRNGLQKLENEIHFFESKMTPGEVFETYSTNSKLKH